MNRCADLELGLHRYDAENYSLDFRLNMPDSDSDVRLTQGQPVLVKLDLDTLNSLLLQPDKYGEALARQLFAEPAVQTAFEKARTAAEAQDVDLRLRLLVGPTATELLALRWETLRDPRDFVSPLFTQERLLLSRYISSLDLRPLRLRPKANLRALVVVANPTGLDRWKLSPLDVDLEVNRAKEGLVGIPVTELATRADTPPVTLNAIAEALREGYDVLYIVAHGMLFKGEPLLWLQDEAGQTTRVSGNDLATRIRELVAPPRVVMLVSCQSAAPTSEGALSALGPRLAESGVPAVLAMQGNFSMDTAKDFLPAFFAELQKDGQIDRALTVARGEVRTRPDYWMPVLFMRLKSGRIWYVPGFGDDRKSFEKWPALIRSVRKGQCTPILGFGLLEPMLGSTRDIAQRWAEAFHYPMEPHEREDLPQVAQFLSVNQDRAFPRDELGDYLRGETLRRYKDILPADLQNNGASLDDMIDAVGAYHRQRNPNDPFKVLANLPLPIYITTLPDNQLASALREANKKPEVAICPWNEDLAQLENIFERERDYKPTPDRPLVYHLFGRLSEPDSLVLTEDDYFDYLSGLTSNKELIPPVVRRALADSALLFLGFYLDNWDFRVVYRSIMGQQGGGRRSRYAHVAGQVEPEEGRILEPDRARQYLERYFQYADISLFWGSPEDFMREFAEHWAKVR